jgi:putative ABC transport system ATP-binding protein
MSGPVPVLRALDLYRFYRSGDEETLALRGVTVELRPGEVVALSGPSGSGKSTLLGCISGIDEPSGGTVWVDGHRMSGQTEARRARLRARYVGAMSQTGDLLPHLTLRDNLRLVRRIGGRRGDGSDILADLGILERAGAWPHQLSGGELARAALALAIANDSPVLLADEPTGELDESTEQRLLVLLRGRAETGTAVLVASHSPAVRRAADRALDLTDGRLAA